ncbi:unnamed protein product, partial [Arabidopsis halleri]
ASGVTTTLRKSIDQDFDFFYFVLQEKLIHVSLQEVNTWIAMQWPGAYCDSRHICCYMKVFWFDEQYCKGQREWKWTMLSCPSNAGIKVLTHEWEKHGTCAESALDQT